MKLTKVEQIKENLASIKCKANAMNGLTVKDYNPYS